ncbi:MAG: hypothetical protein ACW981_13130 [Candidatus Hodarchaeales archaeon]|jgi:hypothetical protein
MWNYSGFKFIAFFFLLIITGQVILITNIVMKGYFQPFIQYEVHYDPAFEIGINESLQPPTHIERYAQGSMNQNGLFMDVFEIEEDHENSTIGFWITQLPLSSVSQKQVEISNITISNEIFPILAETKLSARIIGNGTLFWVMTKEQSTLENRDFLILNLEDNRLTLLQNISISPENQEQEGLTFLHHIDIFYFQNAAWIWELYEESSSGKVVHYLAQYHLGNGSFLGSKKLPNVLQGLEITDMEIIAFNNESIWIHERETGFYKEYSWSGELLSEANLVFPNKELKSVSDDHLGLRGTFVSKDSFIWLIEERIFTESKSELVGFYLVPFNEALRPWPVIDFSIWIIFSIVGVIGVLIVWKKRKKR